MQTALASHEQAPVTPSMVEYTIYGYDSFECERQGCNRWQRISTSDNLSQTLSEAESLFNSAQFHRIEVKKKIFNDKKGIHTASIFRVYEKKENNRYLTFTAILLLVFAMGELVWLKFF